MININQEVTIKWFTRNKKRFIDLRIPYWEYKNIENILHTEINKCKLEDIVQSHRKL